MVLCFVLDLAGRTFRGPHEFGLLFLLFSCRYVDVHLQHQQRTRPESVVLVRPGGHEGLDEVDVALNAFADDFLPDDGVEEHIKLDDDFPQVV